MKARTFRTRTRGVNTKIRFICRSFYAMQQKKHLKNSQTEKSSSEVKSVKDKQPFKSTTKNVTSR